jgi:hypothetical protein
VLEAYSVSHGKASAYLPFIDLLKSYFKITVEDDERTEIWSTASSSIRVDAAVGGFDARISTVDSAQQSTPRPGRLRASPAIFAFSL